MTEQKKEKEVIKLKELYEKKPLLAKKKAKEDFLIARTSTKDIHAMYGIPLSTLNHWVYNGSTTEEPWREVREEADRKAIDQIIKGNIEEVSDTLEIFIRVIKRGIVGYEVKVDSLSITEIQKLTAAAQNLHKVMRLEQNKPTSIEENVVDNRSVQDIIAEIQAEDEFEDLQIEGEIIEQ